MRMRKKKNLVPRMERCSAVLITDPFAQRGQWRTQFQTDGELHVELGCGKGRFTAETAQQNPGISFVAIERVPDAMVMAMERVCAMGLQNVRFISCDAAQLHERRIQVDQCGGLRTRFAFAAKRAVVIVPSNQKRDLLPALIGEVFPAAQVADRAL